MYTISVYDYFSSAHQLRGYKGKCEELHGHNWKVEVKISGRKLDDIGLLVDFTVVKEILKKNLDELDHKFLNQVPPFDTMNPSSENLARHLFEKISPALPEGTSLTAVSVWESERSKATYYPG